MFRKTFTLQLEYALSTSAGRSDMDYPTTFFSKELTRLVLNSKYIDKKTNKSKCIS